MRRGIAVLITFCCVGLLTACGSSGSSTSSTTVTTVNPASGEVNGDPLTIKTDDGAVHGVSQDSTRQFLGIPFAQPPVGNLRWVAPQAPTPWTTTLQATSTKSSCPQILPVVNAPEGNEDCLYLNVFTPQNTSSTPRAVMVWIYGGGFDVGSSTDDNPASFAQKNNVVTVAMNYRLGPLGFLALPALAAADPNHSTGNLGLLDQQAALKWVQANIASFGGNPKNVTIFGESAGGISVCDQILSPMAKGLFAKGITESGPCTTPGLPLNLAEAQGVEFSTKLGCAAGPNLLTCLRSKSTAQVINALPPDPSFLFGTGGDWDPTADGVVLPTNSEAALKAGKFTKVPMIIGANRDEGRLFVALHYNAVGSNLTDAQWATEVDNYFGPTVGPEVQKEYPLADYPDAGAAFGQAMGDAILACPAVQSASIMSNYVPVHEYEYDQTPNPFVLPTPGIDLGAFHSSELPYVFDESVESSGTITFTPAQQTLANQMNAAWARFAITGNPSGPGITWPQLGHAGGSYESLNTPNSVQSNMKSQFCAFWASNGWTIANALEH